MKIFHLTCFSCMLLLLASCGIDTTTSSNPAEIPVETQPATPATPIEVVVTGTTTTPTPTPIQTISGVILDTENTGSVSDKNIYKNENYGFQMVLPKEVYIHEVRDADGKNTHYNVCAPTMDPSYDGTTQCGQVNSQSMGGLSVTPIAEYESTKNMCMMEKDKPTDDRDPECIFGYINQTLIGKSNTHVITFMSPQEGPSDGDMAFGLFGIDTYQDISIALISRFSLLAK